jgi:hypothetical protein
MLPDFEALAQCMGDLFMLDENITESICLDASEASRICTGMILFEKPSLDCTDQENEESFRRIFRQIWQASAGQSAESFNLMFDRTAH